MTWFVLLNVPFYWVVSGIFLLLFIVYFWPWIVVFLILFLIFHKIMNFRSFVSLGCRLFVFYPYVLLSNIYILYIIKSETNTTVCYGVRQTLTVLTIGKGIRMGITNSETLQHKEWSMHRSFHIPAKSTSYNFEFLLGFIWPNPLLSVFIYKEPMHILLYCIS